MCYGVSLGGDSGLRNMTNVTTLTLAHVLSQYLVSDSTSLDRIFSNTNFTKNLLHKLHTF